MVAGTIKKTQWVRRARIRGGARIPSFVPQTIPEMGRGPFAHPTRELRVSGGHHRSDGSPFRALLACMSKSIAKRSAWKPSTVQKRMARAVMGGT